MTYIHDFMNFIEKATSPIQSVLTAKAMLDEAGFIQLEMKDSWRLSANGSYYVIPYPTTIVAFKVSGGDIGQPGFRIVTAHTDTPGFKVKPNPEMTTKGYLKLNTELYCQPMFYSWLDRPISIAGHVVVKGEDVFSPTLVPLDIPYPLMTVPSLAIHFNREVNKGATFNPQKDMLPILGPVKESFEKEGYLLNLLTKETGCSKESILDYDLYLYIQEAPSFVGQDKAMVSAPRVDNQASVYGAIKGLIDGAPTTGIALAACFDNEEIGSATKQGADSLLLSQIIERIAGGIGKMGDQLYRMYASSFMLSADGAHALHPNVPEKNDPTNEPIIGGGVAVKVSAKQSYTTDGVSAGIIKDIFERNQLSYQYLVNRSDEPGGRTLGQMVAKYIPIKGVDVGLPMLAMHSARELFGTDDFEDMMTLFKAFYGY